MALVPVRKRERSDLARLRDEMDELVSGFFEGWDVPFWGHRHWPAIDIAESEDEFLVKAEVPGCRTEDIDVSVCGNMLTIKGEKKQEEEKKGKGYYHIERAFGSFRRDLSLSSDVNPDEIDAVCKDGILSITLPKTEKAKAIKVKVKEE